MSLPLTFSAGACVQRFLASTAPENLSASSFTSIGTSVSFLIFLSILRVKDCGYLSGESGRFSVQSAPARIGGIHRLNNRADRERRRGQRSQRGQENDSPSSRGPAWSETMSANLPSGELTRCSEAETPNNVWRTR